MYVVQSLATGVAVPVALAMGISQDLHASQPSSSATPATAGAPPAGSASPAKAGAPPAGSASQACFSFSQATTFKTVDKDTIRVSIARNGEFDVDLAGPKCLGLEKA